MEARPQRPPCTQQGMSSNGVTRSCCYPVIMPAGRLRGPCHAQTRVHQHAGDGYSIRDKGRLPVAARLQRPPCVHLSMSSADNRICQSTMAVPLPGSRTAYWRSSRMHSSRGHQHVLVQTG